MTIDQRVELLRSEMLKNNLDAYIIPSNDPHQSEYVAEHWKAREWISGFTGSAGTVVITADHAGLWTDSRYFLQGEEELKGSQVILHKMMDQNVPGQLEWLKINLKPGMQVGLDGSLFSILQKERYEKRLNPSNIDVVIVDDLCSNIWQNRPELPKAKAFEHPLEFTGRSRSEKLNDIREKMKDAGADYHFVSTLDDIAWIFNIRGRDVEFNPVVIAYALIGFDKTYLFIDQDKVEEALENNLRKDNIEIRNYTNTGRFLEKLPEKSSILIHRQSININMYEASSVHKLIGGKLISRHLKAVKNPTELKHYKSAMTKDGVALIKAFMWLEEALIDGEVSEYEFSSKLAEFRSQQEGYYGESFAAIIGYNGNGAIIHYRPEKDKCAQIRAKGILLADSGGQYMNGTTDITRTIALSPPSESQKDAYTRVLKGHISLAMAIYPHGTIGGQLDILARKPLWDAGLNYLHGTGHGVGFFLNVHEPPQGFTAGLSSRSNTVLKPGMVTSNEPGHYKTGEYGIRIENLVVTVESEIEGFYQNETITYFPIDTTLIAHELLTNVEKTWLNDYHLLVKQQLSPNLEQKEIEWLSQKCMPI